MTPSKFQQIPKKLIFGPNPRIKKQYVSPSGHTKPFSPPPHHTEVTVHNENAVDNDTSDRKFDKRSNIELTSTHLFV